jgi:hypothetical protein
MHNLGGGEVFDVNLLILDAIILAVAIGTVILLWRI